MAYDIFISYRRDGGSDYARKLQLALLTRKYEVFFDVDELRYGKFDHRILEAIDSAPIFMLVLSPHALDRCVNADDWVRKEIEYAIKKKRYIIPVNPDRLFDGFPAHLPESLKSGLGQHQFSEIMFGQLFMASVDKMVHDRIEPLLQQLGRAAAAAMSKPVGALFHIETDMECRILKFGKEIAAARPGDDTIIRLLKGCHKLEFVSTEYPDDRLSMLHSVEDNDMEDIIEVALLPVREKRLRDAAELTAKAAKASAARNVARQPAPQQSVKTYKVGDYYNENGREGVVFEVDATGRHGKIVGMKGGYLQWCTTEECYKGVVTGADDKTDGMKNMQAIRRIAGWREKYPAFAWCAAQGDGWYLPAIEELKKFTLNKQASVAVNWTLGLHRGNYICSNGKLYWSSSEYSNLSARYLYERLGWNTSVTGKTAVGYVRAVSAF